ncbi:helix-turn-helix domain-containing protein [Phyllobacterium sp. LjRoot231]|uniref:helix-turn-helix domain-containing protein n=1 Tax=Phyllobacterium sp. LjRoot231 TaxID=3342289 RepID=UPI003F4F6FD5
MRHKSGGFYCNDRKRLCGSWEQIVRLLLRGFPNREIAVGLGIGEKTVKNYMTILMQKLHARNRLEVLIAAQKLEVGGHGEPMSRH